MTTTFEFLDYIKMRSLHDKCKEILDLLGTHVPKDYDYLDSFSENCYSSTDFLNLLTENDNSLRLVEEKEIAVVEDYVFDISREKLITYSHTYRNTPYAESMIDKNTSQDFIKELITTKRVFDFEVRYCQYAYTVLPQYSYFNTILESCRKLLKVLSQESSVNLLNMQLAASSQFINELDIEDIKQHLVKTNNDEIKEMLEIKMKNLIEEKVQEENDKISRDLQWITEERHKKLAELGTTSHNTKQEPRKGFFQRLFSN